jgi:hypothetical protein
VKDNKIQEILDAWNEGKPVWLNGEKHTKDKGGILSYNGFAPWCYGSTYYRTASLTPPEEPKKKTRKMTALEKAYRQGARCVFRNEGSGVWWTSIFTSNQNWDENTTKMARILDEGRSLGEWVDCVVEVEG